MQTLAFGGVSPGSRKLNTPYSRWFIVGAATTTNYLANADVNRWRTESVPATSATGVPKVDPNTWDGTDITTGVPLAPTVAGRTLDVTSTGEAGVDWANVGAQGSSVTLSNTTIGTVLTNSDKTGYTLTAADKGIMGDTLWKRKYSYRNPATYTDSMFGRIFIDSLRGNRDSVHAVHVETDALNGASLANLDATVSSRMAKTDSSVIRGNIVDQKITVGSGGQVLTVRGIDSVRSGGIDSTTFNDNVKQPFFGRIDAGTAQSVTGSSITLRASAPSDSLRGAWVTVLSATTGANQTRMIAAYNGTSKAASLSDAWAVTPTGTITYLVWRGFAGVTVGMLYPDATKEIADSTRNGLGTLIADSTWKSLLSARSGVAGSFGDSSRRWAYTAAGGSALDTSAIWHLLQAMWGIPAGSGGFDNTYTNGDSLSLAQRGATTTGGSCTFGTTYTDTVYFRNTTTSSNIPNAIATVKNASGSVLGKIQADANGRYVGTFDASTYLLYPHLLSGISWTDNPDTFAVTGNGQNDTIRGQTISYPAPPLGGQISVSGNVYDLLGDSVAGVTVEFSLNQNAYFSTDDTTNMVLVTKTARSRQTDVSGQWSIPLYPTTKLLGDDRRKGVYYTCKIYMPDGTTTFESTGQITFSHDNCCQVFQYKNYRPWVSQ